MSERKAEPIFCSECQNEVDVHVARALDGEVLCRADLAKRPFLVKLRARKLPENHQRRSGRVFRSLFTSIAALMLVVGVVVNVRSENVAGGVSIIFASVFVAVFGMLAGDILDVLLDIFDQLRRKA